MRIKTTNVCHMQFRGNHLCVKTVKKSANPVKLFKIEVKITRTQRDKKRKICLKWKRDGGPQSRSVMLIKGKHPIRAARTMPPDAKMPTDDVSSSTDGERRHHRNQPCSPGSRVVRFRHVTPSCHETRYSGVALINQIVGAHNLSSTASRI